MTHVQKTPIIIKTQDDLKLAWSKTFNTPAERQANGIIYTSDDKIVARAQEKFILEYPNGLFVMRNPDTTIEYCEDGTVIRLYNYKGEWRTATTRCINGKDSYFSAKKTFDDMFWELFDRTDTSQLDTLYTFVFILVHVENRIVIKHANNKLVYVCRINNETGVEFYDAPIDLEYTILSRVETIKYDNEETVQELIEKHDTPTKRGLILRLNQQMYLYDFDKYKKVRKVRGNSPDIVYRYLSLLGDDDAMMLFRASYSEYIDLFTRINKALYALYKKTFNMYSKVFVYRTEKEVEPSCEFIMRMYHKAYKAKGSRLMEEDVIGMFYSIRAYKLYPLVSGILDSSVSGVAQ